MNKIIILVLITFSVSAFSQEIETDTTFTEYHDGKLWKYIIRNDIIVGSTCYEYHDEYGKYFQLLVYLKNKGEYSLVLHPENISATIFKNNKSKSLLVYPYEKYMKKIERKQK